MIVVVREACRVPGHDTPFLFLGVMVNCERGSAAAIKQIPQQDLSFKGQPRFTLVSQP